ncbi:MAG: cytochrome C peroxidase [Planctomycetes bacterium]|nr:cytochrome C peroxidase [Planctomycetota bacterium]
MILALATRPRRGRSATFLLGAAACLTGAAALANEAREPDDLRRSKSDHELRRDAPRPLSSVPVPEPPNLSDFVRDRGTAVILGKALFWDQRVGSQGQACASCHFQAGADPRVKNQLSPGLLADDVTFQRTASGGNGGPNYTLRREDFPFHRKVDPLKNDERRNNTAFDTNDVASSQGVALARFLGLEYDPVAERYHTIEDGADPDQVFKVGGVKTRQVEPRNTPTVINAVFNHRNFWDGRANFIFNGVDPFGRRTNAGRPDQGVWEASETGALQRVQVELPFASLASQAVGPPTNALEMSAAGKTFPHLGRLLLRHYPLSLQTVHEEDSVLAELRRADGAGLWVTYEALVQQAFQPRWWASTDEVQVGDALFRQIEANFSLFFGLAVMLYQSTLVSDQSRFEAFALGDDAALTEVEKFGLEVFLNQGKCINCHSGPTFSGASIPVLLGGVGDEREQLVERMKMERGIALYDAGFYNIGVRPTREDLGVGGRDPLGNPLSFSQQLADGRVVDGALDVDPRRFDVQRGRPVGRGERTAVRGAFKTPTLLNVELTAPYMHNGGMLTLEQTVEFYARGGDFHAANIADLDPDVDGIGKIRGKPQRIGAVAAFMRALTDERVRDERAPFDHPSLVVPNGLVGDEVAASATDEVLLIPAVGRRGRADDGVPPIRLFLQED